MKVIFSPHVYAKLRAYVTSIDYEISGLGRVERVGEDFVITDVRIFKQIVNGGHTNIDQLALAQFYNEIIDEENDLSKWKLWWHSHCTFEAFFSGTDAATIDDFNSEMPTDNWMLSLVSNHLGQTLIRADVFEPIRCTIPDIPFDIDFHQQMVPLDYNSIDQEIEEKVTITFPKKKKAAKQQFDVVEWARSGHGKLVKRGTQEYVIDFSKKGKGTSVTTSSDIKEGIIIPDSLKD